MTWPEMMFYFIGCLYTGDWRIRIVSCDSGHVHYFFFVGTCMLEQIGDL